MVAKLMRNITLKNLIINNKLKNLVDIITTLALLILYKSFKIKRSII
jgi:hypothetical protein